MSPKMEELNDKGYWREGAWQGFSNGFLLFSFSSFGHPTEESFKLCLHDHEHCNAVSVANSTSCVTLAFLYQSRNEVKGLSNHLG